MSDLAMLPTEARNPRTEHIGDVTTLEMLRLLNDEDATVAAAVTVELPQVALAVDAIADRFVRGGRLFYIGAGTSGRLGVLDASECPPTFGVPPELFQGIIAGGDAALRRSVEGAEDSFAQGALDLAARGFGKEDALVGIAASGRTPYVLGALEYATEQGGATIGLSCVPGSPLARAAEIAITPNTGAEAITGSTRLKAGAATKMVLNMLSTGVMVRRGAVHGNLMVNVQLTNEKLRDRGRRIVMAATGCDEETAGRLLQESGDVKTAVARASVTVSQR